MADEIPDVKGLAGGEHDYFTNVRDQLSHAVSAVDAASDALSSMLDIGLNRLTFLFTAVATVFLPISFLVGFWGMNFQVMIDHITSPATFWLLGIGGLTLTALASLWAIRRQLGSSPSPSSGGPPGDVGG
ncbi:MAG: CorA family divalent cation transporter [Solirubrobacterales bacterium]